MAIASGPTGPVLAGPVLMFEFQNCACADDQLNNQAKILDHGALQSSKQPRLCEVQSFDSRALRLSPCVYHRSGNFCLQNAPPA